jgi:flagellar motor protein MotB
MMQQRPPYLRRGRKTIIASLIAGLVSTLCQANEPRCQEGGFCLLPEQPGNSPMVSLVQVRAANNLPSSSEIRLPDEVVVLSLADAGEETQGTVEYDEVTVKESRQLSEQAGGIRYPSGEEFLSLGERTQLQALATRLAGKLNVRLAIIGHADEQKLSPRKKRIYGDNRGLSEARANAAANFLRVQPGWEGVQITTAGKGDSEPAHGTAIPAAFRDTGPCEQP